jgi:hypothetical protein
VIRVARGRVQWRTLVNTVGIQNVAIHWLAERLLASQEGLCTNETVCSLPVWLTSHSCSRQLPSGRQDLWGWREFIKFSSSFYFIYDGLEWSPDKQHFLPGRGLRCRPDELFISLHKTISAVLKNNFSFLYDFFRFSERLRWTSGFRSVYINEFWCSLKPKNQQV